MVNGEEKGRTLNLGGPKAASVERRLLDRCNNTGGETNLLTDVSNGLQLALSWAAQRKEVLSLGHSKFQQPLSLRVPI